MEAGIGSSAAVAVATLTAINHLYELNLSALYIARIGRIVQNRIVGVPYGAMDTITVAIGQQDHLLSIRRQPDQILETVPLPLNTKLIGIHSRAERSPSSSAYIDARTAAFMGLTILQRTLDLEELRDNYLCRLSVKDFRSKVLEGFAGADERRRFPPPIRRAGRSAHRSGPSKGVQCAQPCRASDL